MGFTLNFMDFPRSWQIFFQKPGTTMMEGVIDLHHDIFTFLIIILSFVSIMLLAILTQFIEKEKENRVVRLNGSHPYMKYKNAHGVTHHTLLETVWTIIPTLILLAIVAPSFALIYALDEIIEPQLTLRVVGRQWYWTYEYPDYVDIQLPTSVLQDSQEGTAILKTSQFGAQQPTLSFLIPGFSFNSYLVPTEDLFEGSFRLLEVTRRVVIPVLTNVRILVTSYDVLHSWAVPSFAVKVDAIPGRLNEYFIHVNFLGIFYGQCSEICGVNHGFMPIKIETVTEEFFRWWYLETSLDENPALKFRDSF